LYADARGIEAATLASGVFDGLAAGTFVYVAIADLVPRELRGGHHPLWLCSGFTVGIAITATVRIWT
jgi:zinc transporter ZupT